MYLRSLAVVILVGLGLFFTADKAQLANPDQFPNLDQYNAASRELRATGVWRWYYSVAPGCSGNLRPAIESTHANITAETGITFIEDSNGWRQRVSCGVDMSVSCGSNTAVIGCLGEGYPLNVNIKYRDTMATFQFISQIAIVLHELFGHAMATWNEQYAFVDGQFFCTPVVDIMTCGPTSWHYIGPTERARWERTMMPSYIVEAYLDLGAGVIWHGPSNDRATRTAVFTQEIIWPEWGPFTWTGLQGCLNGVLANQCWASPIPANLPPCTAVYLAPENGMPLSWGGYHPERAIYAGATPC